MLPCILYPAESAVADNQENAQLWKEFSATWWDCLVENVELWTILGVPKEMISQLNTPGNILLTVQYVKVNQNCLIFITNQNISDVINQAMQCRLPYETLNQSWRKVESSSSGKRNACSDSKYLRWKLYIYLKCSGSYSFKKQWYRFSEPAGSQMLTAPSPYEGYSAICSHDRAGWMSGTHPRVGEDPVRRRICFASRDFGQDCQYSVEAQVVACQDRNGPFYLYELPPTPQCSLLYCAQ